MKTLPVSSSKKTEPFGTSATVFRKINLMNYNSTVYHVKLSDVENDIVNPLFFNDKNKYIIKQFNFDKIPGSPIAYWIDDNLIACFNNTKLESLANVKQGLATADNNRFLRYWWEVDFNNIGFSSINCEDSKNTNKKWFPYNKGGEKRRWYGNQEFVVNWENDGKEIKELACAKYKCVTRTVTNIDSYFIPGLPSPQINFIYITYFLIIGFKTFTSFLQSFLASIKTIELLASMLE